MAVPGKVIVFVLALGCAVAGYTFAASDPKEAAPKAISSRILKTAASELVLVQEAVLEAPVARVWHAYSTQEGWEAWAAKKAKVDLRVDGKILTRYDDGEIGAPGTNTLHILGYVPEELLTLRAELSSNWPEVLQKDADKLSNTIVFDALSETRTRVRSYGIGYSDSEELSALMKYFISANEGLLAKLKVYVEKPPATTGK
ncbi:MAG: SRPBCC domain-containing protein [Planctomycetota bacterium]